MKNQRKKHNLKNEKIKNKKINVDLNNKKSKKFKIMKKNDLDI